MVISMDRWKGKVAVVTGASSGIGAAIAERLVENGLKVVGLARRKEEIESLSNNLHGKPGKLYACKLDITIEDEIIKVFHWIKQNVGPISILINCAGIARYGDLGNLRTKLLKIHFDINVFGLSIATREAIKMMDENKIDGHIVNISSISARMSPFRGIGFYSASKASVNILTEALRKELIEKKSKIKISLISPGAVDTNIIDPAVFDKSTNPMLDPKDIADAAEFILSTPPAVQVHELVIKPLGEVY